MVIFDCDGVLVDSEPVANRLLADFLTEHGAVVSQHECHDLFVGRPLQDIINDATAKGGQFKDSWREDFYERMDTALSGGVPLIDGVVTLLDRVDQADMKTAIVSNGRFAKMKLTLGPHGLWDRFEGKMYSPQTHGKPKPAPDMFLLAAKNAGVAPGDCVVIDDSPSGVTGAIAAGMTCIGYAQDTPKEKLEALGATTATNMEQVGELLGLIKG
ncbi:HAD family hydrolase [Aliiroseovarius sp. 2305UL8-7]|uniref:HAD family hydrolase n=1 Tax=Aliiroseovarius conchicola TaxID=3121637 RepID=UPI003528A530